MSVDFSGIIDNFLTAELGEDVRGSLVLMARALQDAINSQLLTVTTDLTDDDPNAAAQAAIVGAALESIREEIGTDLLSTITNYGVLPDGSDVNDLLGNGALGLMRNSFVSLRGDYTYENAPFSDGGYLLSVGLSIPGSSGGLQVGFGKRGNVFSRILTAGVFSDWFGGIDNTVTKQYSAADAKAVRDLFNRTRLTGTNYTYGASADSLIENGIYFSSTTDEYPNGTITNLPYASAGWLEVTRSNNTSNPVLQVFYPYYGTNARSPKRRFRKSNLEWTDWFDFCEIVNNNYTNNFNYEILQNTYNVTATPTINTGIPYVLTSTGDTTDRTADIAAVLAVNGFCMLGTGTFYVSNLSIGTNQSLRGSGIGNTVIRMVDGANGNAVSLGTRSSISDLTIFGGAETMPTTNGGRNGIGWQGTYISPENIGSYPYRGQINNLTIYGFSGAGVICSNTSMNIATGLNAVNVNIYRCWAGVYIPIYSEYHRFTNIEIDGCYYGVINNGGNNMFANCGFNSNQIAFYIDNSSDQSPNNAHGSAVGCTFNHSGNNEGTAIKIDGASAGYIFSGCQIFYGKIDIKNSVGINFTSCNVGLAVPISINGGGVVLFNSNLFRETPTVTKTNSPIVISSECYIRDTGAVVSI